MTILQCWVMSTLVWLKWQWDWVRSEVASCPGHWQKGAATLWEEPVFCCCSVNS